MKLSLFPSARVIRMVRAFDRYVANSAEANYWDGVWLSQRQCNEAYKSCGGEVPKITYVPGYAEGYFERRKARNGRSYFYAPTTAFFSLLRFLQDKQKSTKEKEKDFFGEELNLRQLAAVDTIINRNELIAKFGRHSASIAHLKNCSGVVSTDLIWANYQEFDLRARYGLGFAPLREHVCLTEELHHRPGLESLGGGLGRAKGLATLFRWKLQLELAHIHLRAKKAAKAQRANSSSQGD